VERHINHILVVALSHSDVSNARTFLLPTRTDSEHEKNANYAIDQY